LQFPPLPLFSPPPFFLSTMLISAHISYFPSSLVISPSKNQEAGISLLPWNCKPAFSFFPPQLSFLSFPGQPFSLRHQNCVRIYPSSFFFPPPSPAGQQRFPLPSLSGFLFPERFSLQHFFVKLFAKYLFSPPPFFFYLEFLGVVTSLLSFSFSTPPTSSFLVFFPPEEKMYNQTLFFSFPPPPPPFFFSSSMEEPLFPFFFSPSYSLSF